MTWMNCMPILSIVFILFRAAATGPTYPAQQSGYAVAQPAAAYGAQRPTGFDPAAYQQASAATQGTYAGEFYASIYSILALEIEW